jgi:predicted small lipoprotein YifL
MSIRPFRLLFPLLLCGLAACGNRGPLVLPEDAPPPMPAPAADPASAPAEGEGAGR